MKPGTATGRQPERQAPWEGQRGADANQQGAAVLYAAPAPNLDLDALAVSQDG